MDGLTFKQRLKTQIEKRFVRFLQQQVPRNSKQQLTQRNIFIFPSRFGLSYLVFVFVLFILGTNYQNNIIILFSFILGSLFLTAMMHTFNNLRGLVIEFNAGDLTGFCDAAIYVPLLLDTNNTKYNLTFKFPEGDELLVDSVSGHHQLNLPVIIKNRGISELQRLTLTSYYALGLFRCWTRLDLNIHVLAYPRPEKPSSFTLDDYLKSTVVNDFVDSNQQQISPQRGVDEFSELKTYQQGESLAKVAWKQVARGQGWYVKSYQRQESVADNWLSLDDLPSANLEQRLRWLSYLIVQLQKRDQEFGLKLGAIEIMPNQGNEHIKRCLKEVALYANN